MPARSEEAFRRHYAPVFRYIRRRTPDDHQAEEVTQTVFADAARSLERFKPGAGPVLAWLYTVAQRRLADRARSLALRGEVAGLDEVEATERLEYGAQVAEALRAGLDRLPSEQRRVVVMKLLHGASFAEIASRVDSAEAACKMRFARGLETLRDEFEREGLEP